MGAFGGFYVTNDGLALQAKAQSGTQLQYTKIKVGDGDLGGQDIENLHDLINTKKELSITDLKTQPSEGKAIVSTVLSNQDITTGFYLREMGVFALDPDEGEILYCYGNAGAGAEFIPPGGGPDVIEQKYNVITIVGNAQNVSAVIDTSLVYAMKDDFDAHVADTDGVHGATSDATAERIIQRDENGRAKVTAPYDPDDIARKQETDAALSAAQAAQDTADNHASRHATGGPDELSPADIGAETPAGAQEKADDVNMK